MTDKCSTNDPNTALILHELGKISGKLDAMETHQKELRELQTANNKAVWDQLNAHDDRIRKNENELAKRATLVSGATALVVAMLTEIGKSVVKG